MVLPNDIKIQICKSIPPYFIHKNVACLFYFEHSQNDNGVGYIQEYFINQIKSQSIEAVEKLINSLVKYYSICNDEKANPIIINEETSNKNTYIDSNFNELNNFHDKILEDLLISEFDKISEKLSKLISEANNLTGSDLDLAMAEFRSISINPKRIYEFQNSDSLKTIEEVITNKLRKKALQSKIEDLDQNDFISCTVSIGSFVDKLNLMITNMANMVQINESILRSRIANYDNLQFIKISEIVNGYVKPLDENWTKFEIIVNKGLWDLLLFVPYLYINHIRISDPDDSAKKEDQVTSMKDLPKYAEQLMENLFENDKNCGDFFKIVELSRKSEKHQKFIDMMIDSARDFIIGHELGHVLINLYSDKIQNDLFEIAALFNKNQESLLKLLHSNNEPINFSYKNWLEEFVADKIGLNLCLQKSKHPVADQIIVGASRMVFQSMILADNYKRKYYCLTQSDLDIRRKIDHPPNIVRDEMIKLSIPEKMPDIFGKTIEDVNRFILSKW